MGIPMYQGEAFAFHQLRVGAAIVRRGDNASVYFQPGDDTAEAIAAVGGIFDMPEMWPGENREVFDRWASQFFHS